MKMLAEKGDFNLYEDDDFWILLFKKDGSEFKRYSKKEHPKYPIAAIAKWGYRVVDNERVNEIAEETMKQSAGVKQGIQRKLPEDGGAGRIQGGI